MQSDTIFEPAGAEVSAGHGVQFGLAAPYVLTSQATAGISHAVPAWFNIVGLGQIHCPSAVLTWPCFGHGTGTPHLPEVEVAVSKIITVPLGHRHVRSLGVETCP